MALPVVPATVKASWFYTLNGEPAMNRMHIGVAATLPSAGDCATIASAMANWWLTNCVGLVPPVMSLRAVEVISIAEANGPQATFSAGLPTPGTHNFGSMPGNCSFCVSLRTGLTGRSARGRWYWAGLCEDQVLDNTVNSGTITSIVGAIDNLLTTITALSAFPVIVSYISGGVPRPGGPVKFIITDALATDNIVDSQRGRLH